MSTKNYVLSVLALLLVLASSASALVINTPTTWTVRTAIHTQTGQFVQIDAGGSVTTSQRVDLDGVDSAGTAKLIINGGTFTSTGTGNDFNFKLPDNNTGFPCTLVINSGTFSAAEMQPWGVVRKGYVSVGAGTMLVYGGYNPYLYIGASGYYRPNGTFVAGTGDGSLTPQSGFKLVVEDLGGDDYKIYGIASIYGENPTNNALLIDRNPASVCFDSFDIEIAKVYFGPGDFNDLNYYDGCMPQLGANITGLNPAGSLDTCTSLASKIPLTYGKWSWAVEGFNAKAGQPTEPNTLIQRRVFQFTVAKEPVVRVQPVRQLVFGGQTATFTAEVDSFNAPTSYNWYKGTPPTGTLVSAGTIESLGSFRYRLTLNKTNVQWADKGDYYCTVANSDGSVNTGTAPLKVKAELAHWDFEDDLDDTASKTYNPVVYNGTPSKTAVYVASSGLDTKALSFDGTSAGQYVDLPDGFDDFTGGQTFAVWAYMDSTAAASVRYIDLAAAQASTADPLNAINMSRGNSANLKSLLFRAGSTATFPNTILTNTWQHFVATVDDNGAVQLYVNGVPTQSGALPLAANVARVQNYIGRTVSVFGATTEPARFKGKIGDLRVYNYAISADDAATLYAASAGSFCRTQPDMDKIVNGGNNNCRVDLAEFANFAKNWLDCGLFPVTACP